MRDNQGCIQAVFGLHNRVLGCALKRATLLRREQFGVFPAISQRHRSHKKAIAKKVNRCRILIRTVHSEARRGKIPKTSGDFWGKLGRNL